MKQREYFLYAKQKNDYSTIHLNENRISKSLVALRAGTLQILVAQKFINLTSLNKKVINVNQKHFQYTKINKYQGKSFILRAHKRCFIRHYRQDKKKNANDPFLRTVGSLQRYIHKDSVLTL